MPSARLQKGLALANVIAQIGIMTTGVTVRVTASGLGCETWPRCNQDSFVPVPGAEPVLHQAIEFGNRLLTFVLTAVAIALILALHRAGRRRGILLLAWTLPVGVAAQAVIGGITVLTGLVWWTVALHLFPSMILAWISAVLFIRVGEDDEVTARRVVPTPLAWLTALSAVLLAGVVVLGTMVTGAGPHAGDARVEASERLQWPIQWLVHFHAELTVGYACLLIGLLLGLLALRARGPAIRRSAILIGLTAVQAVLGITQYQLGVPELLVVLHVTLAGIITAVTGTVWAAVVVTRPGTGYTRAPEPAMRFQWSAGTSAFDTSSRVHSDPESPSTASRTASACASVSTIWSPIVPSAPTRVSRTPRRPVGWTTTSADPPWRAMNRSTNLTTRAGGVGPAGWGSAASSFCAAAFSDGAAGASAAGVACSVDFFSVDFSSGAVVAAAGSSDEDDEAAAAAPATAAPPPNATAADPPPGAFALEPPPSVSPPLLPPPGALGPGVLAEGAFGPGALAAEAEGAFSSAPAEASSDGAAGSAGPVALALSPPRDSEAEPPPGALALEPPPRVRPPALPPPGALGPEAAGAAGAAVPASDFSAVEVFLAAVEASSSLSESAAPAAPAAPAAAAAAPPPSTSFPAAPPPGARALDPPRVRPPEAGAPDVEAGAAEDVAAESSAG